MPEILADFLLYTAAFLAGVLLGMLPPPRRRRKR